PAAAACRSQHAAGFRGRDSAGPDARERRAGGGRAAPGQRPGGAGGAAGGGGAGLAEEKNPREHTFVGGAPTPRAGPAPERGGAAGRKRGRWKGGKKNGNGQRLRDMLGFAELESRAQAERDEPQPPRAPSAGSARPAPPQRPQKPAARGPRRVEDTGRMAMPE